MKRNVLLLVLGTFFATNLYWWSLMYPGTAMTQSPEKKTTIRLWILEKH